MCTKGRYLFPNSAMIIHIFYMILNLAFPVMLGADNYLKSISGFVFFHFSNFLFTFSNFCNSVHIEFFYTKPDIDIFQNMCFFFQMSLLNAFLAFLLPIELQFPYTDIWRVSHCILDNSISLRIEWKLKYNPSTLLCRRELYLH